MIGGARPDGVSPGVGAYVARPLDGRRRGRPRTATARFRWRICAGLVAIAVIGLGFYLAYDLGRGSASSSSVTVRSGVAFTNASHETVVTLDGWTYNVPRGVAWINSQGAEADGSPAAPPCLRAGRSAPITFGTTWVPVGGASGVRIQAVVWVKCGLA